MVAIVYKKNWQIFQILSISRINGLKKDGLTVYGNEYVSMKKKKRYPKNWLPWICGYHCMTQHLMYLLKNKLYIVIIHFHFMNGSGGNAYLLPKIVLLSLFSKFIYKKNINKNTFVIVQQQWLKDEFKNCLN